jgi:hypothetical protein
VQLSLLLRINAPICDSKPCDELLIPLKKRALASSNQPLGTFTHSVAPIGQSRQLPEHAAATAEMTEPRRRAALPTECTPVSPSRRLPRVHRVAIMLPTYLLQSWRPETARRDHATTGFSYGRNFTGLARKKPSSEDQAGHGTEPEGRG